MELQIDLPALDPRQERFLATLVAEHVRRGGPIASRDLARIPGVGLSPASVRAILAGLEQLGCISRPHASAGRLPTDLGYRYFVDRLMPIAELPPGERRFVAALVRTASAVMSAESKRIADGFAKLTHQLALVVSMDSGTPRVAYSGARHILEQPEFDSAERLAPLFGLLDERTTLGRLLASLPRPNRVRAWIGRELPIEGMRSFALVAMKTAGHSAWGVGVLGPMRMDYPAIVARLALFGELSEGGDSISIRGRE